MTFLTAREAGTVSDAFLLALYGDDTYREWRALKRELSFTTECEFVRWLMDVARAYTHGEEGELEGSEPSAVEMDEQLGAMHDDGLEGPEDATTTSDGKQQGGELEMSEPLLAAQQVQLLDSDSEPPEPSPPAAQALPVRGELPPELDHLLADDCLTSPPVDHSHLTSPCSATVDTSSCNRGGGGGGVRRCRRAKQYPCGHCPFTTNRVWQLRQHVARVHQQQVGKFNCSYCDYSCGEQYSLRRHVAGVHHKLTPFACHWCRKQFSQKYNVLRHIKTIHRDELDALGATGAADPDPDPDLVSGDGVPLYGRDVIAINNDIHNLLPDDTKTKDILFNNDDNSDAVNDLSKNEEGVNG